MRQYIALIHKEADSDYGVSFPDFPGVITAAKTLDEARLLAEEALTFHIKGLLEDGEAIPEPSSPEGVMADREKNSTRSRSCVEFFMTKFLEQAVEAARNLSPVARDSPLGEEYGRPVL